MSECSEMKIFRNIPGIISNPGDLCRPAPPCRNHDVTSVRCRRGREWDSLCESGGCGDWREVRETPVVWRPEAGLDQSVMPACQLVGQGETKAGNDQTS